ncbi:two-component system chemotaxis sensor kinase CheA [Azospirillum lipoferum]|uniref:Chemotaxis protein CheA n=1 Tax=Azospirillum lipoferum TaxID=193 RepID=A0A5A9GKD7_AZOLI|nr:MULTISPECIES: chemotaxis protein CheA [Azospirillum]KAA0594827.1 chemotaxis protein CheA [Azospirillum lipoferum]MCP1612847.1 two-component system chemotaxis sensor kinase CheA [Azospirillum lipoferum]MDW5532014.1 chemotaxis protein CheA [Azospirillum sp. NL1]
MTGADPGQIFREEAAELLVDLETALLHLEQRPTDREPLDTAFRALHTIKGSGSMFGFEAAASFTHHLESAFDRMRKGELAATTAMIGIALAAKDHIRTLIDDPANADAEAGDAILARLAEQSGSAAMSASLRQEHDDAEGRATWRVRFRLAPDALERGTNPLLLLDELRELGDAGIVALTDDVPPLEELEPTHCHIAWQVILTTAHPRSTIEDVFIFVIDETELTIEPVSASVPEPESAVVASEPPAPPSREPSAVTGHVPPKEPAVPKADAAAEKGKAHPATNSIRVPAERLDDLMDQVGELVIAHARLKQLISDSVDLQIKSVTEEIERLSNGLRDITMGIRMVPVESLFGRFRRLVRDLSQELGKDVVLTMSGEETELDKTMIERLNDPLVHIIRNSLDHGLEPAADRVAAGKPPQGRIHLSARHAGTRVLMTIRDDGRGLDRDRIRAKAEEQDLIPPGAKLSDAELFQLIFHPGFSTARTLTSVSGRGIGMDVVKRTIDGLRGTIEVSSTPGGGTEITLGLPLTLAIIDGLLVRVGQGRYVIPLFAVEECVELPPDVERRHANRNFLNIRGALVPFLRLRDSFGVRHPPDLYQKVVIISSGDKRVGLVVDQVLGDHQTVIKSMSKLHADVANFSGATILGDGSVALILDIAQIVAAGQVQEQRREAS